MSRGHRITLLATATLAGLMAAVSTSVAQRPRARDLGIRPGIFSPGPHNAITDVAGVRVGHATVVRGESIRTGVTAVLPHAGNAFLERVPAALHVGNGFGKLLGVTQLAELGELETPILLTCTLCVWRVADALVAWMLEQPGMMDVRSINPLVGETNDGALNAIRTRPVGAEDVRAALGNASAGPVEEGAVGAGAGTVAFGWKGGIGTSSRLLPASLGGWTVGVLVQSNYGGVLQILGAPVGKELGRHAFRQHVDTAARRDRDDAAGDGAAIGGAEAGDGSIMIVVATDAPLSDRNLRRLAARAIVGLSRTGSSASNGSGDYVVAFSSNARVRRPWDARRLSTEELANEEMSALFQAVAEATEEAIYNSLLKATTVTSNGRTVEALPIDRVKGILARYRVSER